MENAGDEMDGGIDVKRLYLQFIIITFIIIVGVQIVYAKSSKNTGSCLLHGGALGVYKGKFICKDDREIK